MKSLFVSVIIITCNRPSLLRHCLDRVLGQSYPYKEIIVVDSSSDDESEQVVAQHPEVISVRLHGQRNNRPQAYNEGIAAASGDIIAFIDDDAMVQPGWFESLINAYDDQTVGGVGGRVIEIPEPHCDQISGSPRMFVKPSGRVIGQGWGLFSTKTVEVDHLAGGNMSFRRKALEPVGGLDANYTLTNLRVETDLCIRVKKAGWRIMFVPTMAVVHFSLRAMYKPYYLQRPSFQFSNGRNDMYFALKNFGLTPRTLAGQLLDTAICCGRATYLTFLFTTGMVVHIAGRLVGLGVGILWLMSSHRRAESNPKIIRRSHAVNEQTPVPVATESES